jgi:KilA-N domain
MTKSITIQGKKVTVLPHEDQDYICLTEIAKSAGGDGSQVETWLRNKNTLEFLAVWEALYNPDFNSHDFVVIRNDAGTNRFNLSVKEWVKRTKAIGIVAKAGRHGGTYAHKDIALEFASWLSPALRLYVIKEFQRLKEDEERQQLPEWGINRTLAKVNYRLHTDAVKRRLIPPTVTGKESGFIYANEADLINKAVFGMTAKEWKTANPGKDGNIREQASVEQLLVLANVESYNSILIDQGKSQQERIKELNSIARSQLKAMTDLPAVKTLKPPPLLSGSK